MMTKKIAVLAAVFLTFSMGLAVAQSTEQTMTEYSDGDEVNGVVLSNEPSFWTSIPGADWIWAEDTLDVQLGATETFVDTFTVNGVPQSGTLDITADDGYTVWVNGHQVGEHLDNSGVFSSVDTYSVPAAWLHSGENNLTVEVTNGIYTEFNSPAGTTYAMSVDYLESEQDVEKGKKGNNGVGNGVDPQPPGNPPVNDGVGTGPGNPGNRGGR